MDDIVFPPWIGTSPTIALANVLASSLRQAYKPAPGGGTGNGGGNGARDGGPPSSAALQKPRKSISGLKRAESEYMHTVQLDLINAHVRGDVAAEEEQEDVEEDQLDMDRPMPTTLGGDVGATSSLLRALLPPMRARSLTGDSFADFTGVGAATGGEMGDVLYHPSVQQLLRLSHLNELASGKDRYVNQHTAVGMVAFMALAVDCKALPSAITRGFYTECSSLYTNLLANIHNINFAPSLDVSGLVASLVACGLKLRWSEDGSGGGSPGLSTPVAAGDNLSTSGNNLNLSTGSGRATPRPSSAGAAAAKIALSGFDYRAVDAIIMACVPEQIDRCVTDPIALGALEGLSLTHSRSPAYLGPQLVMHLHNLADAFATSDKRRDLSYKKLLCFLLEALSCSKVLDYERTNSWVIAIMQENYVIKGLFQKEVLHARVVAATLRLLIRQYQEMAREAAGRTVTSPISSPMSGVIPDFTEGDQLIELVWRALQGAAGTLTTTKGPPTLYSYNVRVVVRNLLRTEVERLRCYYVITSTAQQGKESPLMGDTYRVSAPTAAAAPSARPQMPTPPYIPSDEEENLRVQIASNIVKFLLLPTSVMKLLPVEDEAAARLREVLAEMAVRVLTVVTSTQFLSIESDYKSGNNNHNSNAVTSATAVNGGNTSANDLGGVPTPVANFSNRYYSRMEGIIRELVQSVILAQSDKDVLDDTAAVNPADPEFSPRSPQADVGDEAVDTSRENNGDGMDESMSISISQRIKRKIKNKGQLIEIDSLEDRLAALCIQGVSVADPHLCSFASSEVMDTIVELTSKRRQTMATAAAAAAGASKAPSPPKNQLASTIQQAGRRRGQAAAAATAGDGKGEDDTYSARRLSLCLTMLCDVVVPMRYSIMTALSVTEIHRFGQLLCDTYEDHLRDVLATSKRSDTLSDAFRQKEVPTALMNVAAQAFFKLVVRVHERLLVIAKDALRSMQGGGKGWNRREHARYLSVINAEGESVRLLSWCAMSCVLNIAWPESGIIYQTAAGEPRPAGPLTQPAAMAPLALSCLSPFLNSLRLLFHLNTLFPVQKLHHLAAHVEHGKHLILDDMSDHYISNYYFQPSTLQYSDDDSAKRSTLFRSFWFMMTFYDFAHQSLAISKRRINAEVMRNTPAGAANAAGGPSTTNDSFNNASFGLNHDVGEANETNNLSVMPLFMQDENCVSTSMITTREAKLIRLLASSAPPLLRMCSLDMHQSMAESVVLLRYLHPSTDPTSTCGTLHMAIRNRLVELWGGHKRKDIVSKLSVQELFLMQALTELELLRSSSGSIANLPIYNHFEIREFVASPAIKKVVMETMGAVCAQYLSSLRILPPGLAPRLVAKDIHQLLLLYCFSVDSVRQAARLLLERVIDTFPAFCTYAGELPLLWTVINLIDAGTVAEVEQLCTKLHFRDLPAIPPPGSAARELQLKELVQLSDYWVAKSMQTAPVALFALATKFIVHHEVVKGASTAGRPPTGARLAMQAAQPVDYKLADDAVRGVLCLGEPSMPNYAGALIKQSHAQGQILSALRLCPFPVIERIALQQLLGLMQDSRSQATVQAINRLRRHLHDAFEALEGRTAPTPSADHAHVQRRAKLAVLQSASLHQIAPSKLYEFETTLFSAVAVVNTGLASPAVDLELLRHIVQTPILLFHADYLQAALGGWKWMLSVNRDRYAVPLLQQVVEGVEWTIGHQLGLFDGASPSQNMAVQTGDEAERLMTDATYPEDYDRRSPHSVLFGFLAEEYVNPGCPCSLDPLVQRYLYELCNRLVTSVELWSLKDSSFAETMRAAVLLLHVCRLLQNSNNRRVRAGLNMVLPFTSIAVLRQRSYTALLRWFRQLPPRWYFARQPDLAAEQMSVLVELATLLRDEHSTLRRNYLGFMDFYINTHAKSEKVLEAQKTRLATARAQLGDLLTLLGLLVQHELQRLQVWQNPRRTLELPALPAVAQWGPLLEAALRHDAAVLVALVRRFPADKELYRQVVRLVVRDPDLFGTIPEAVDLYLTEEVLEAGAPKLFTFTSCTIVQALRLLNQRYAKYPAIAAFAIRSLLSQKKSEYLIFYLPQLLQVLATDESGSIENFLVQTSGRSTMFCHQLLWALQTEGEGDGVLATKCKQLTTHILGRMTEDEKRFYTGEFDFMKTVTSLSGELMEFEKPQRKGKLRERLKDAVFHDVPAQQHVYLPTDSNFRIVDVIPHTAGAMQSAAKCPILVQFRCTSREDEDMRLPEEITQEEEAANVAQNTTEVKDSVVKACIFKMGDDCRQDQISLQLMELFKRVLDAVGVPFYLYPYKVVPTGQDSGIIEVVPNSVSRNEIGKLVESNLAEYFVQTFGHPETASFHRARTHFIESSAAYSVVSFILNIKDRHNGNIMLDRDGHLVHIDFGFLFDTSPGGDMNFESSPFKLTTEMVQLIGKDVGNDSNLRSDSLRRALINEESYIYFKVLVNRAYLAVREYAREICILVEAMLRSGLPCFKPKQTIAHLATRLQMDVDEVHAAHFMRRRIHESRQNLRTVLYDHYQRIAEGIAM